MITNARMISGGPIADAGMFVEKHVLIRGARADPESSLGHFRNVAGMNKEREAMARIPFSEEFVTHRDGKVVKEEKIVPFVKQAHTLLDEDPIDQQKLEDKERQEPAKLRSSDRWSYHLEQLTKVRLLEDDPNDEGMAHLIAGRYTAVWKDVDPPPPIARAIMDMRRLNALCTDSEVPFELLGSKQIADLFKNIDPTKHWGVVHADVSNAYYQMGTGPNLQKRMLLLWGSKYVHCPALVMGYKKSCGIAQGLCGGLLLLTRPGDVDLGIPEEYYSREIAPGCIHLNNGGFIIIIYDSILVVCPKKDQQSWHDRIKRNFETIGNLLLKYCKIAPSDSIVSYCGIEIRVGPNKFQWRVAEATLNTWHKLRHLSVRSTPRTLFKIVGFLRFALDVQGTPRRVLGRISKAQSRLGLVKNWDAEVVNSLDIKRAWSLLDDLLARRKSGRDWQHRKSHIPSGMSQGVVTYAVVAVDATPYRFAAAVLEENGIVSKSIEGAFGEFTDIAHAECTAAMKGLELVSDIEAQVIVQCNDHKAVGRGFWKGYSPQDALDRMVITGLRAIKKKILVQVDVPSAENFADIGTRPDKSFTPEERALRMQCSLARAKEAASIWKATGKDYFSREDFTGEVVSEEGMKQYEFVPDYHYDEEEQEII